MADRSDYKECEVCGMYEICLITDAAGPDYGLYSCFKEGHWFCKDCFPEFHKKITSADNIRRIVKEIEWASEYYNKELGRRIDEDSDEEVIANGQDILADYYAEVPEEECPMCQSVFVRDDDMLEYLLKKLNTTREKVTKEIQNLKSRKT